MCNQNAVIKKKVRILLRNGLLFLLQLVKKTENSKIKQHFQSMGYNVPSI